MKRILIATALISPPLLASPQSGSRNEAVEKEIAQMDRDFHAARLKNDVAAVNRFLTSDYYQIFSGGHRIESGNRGKGPYNTTPNGDRYEKVDVKDQRVRVYGDTAVSTYSRHIDVRNQDGSARQVTLVSTHVWVRRDGRWQIVQSQATDVAQPGPRF